MSMGDCFSLLHRLKDLCQLDGPSVVVAVLLLWCCCGGVVLLMLL